MSHPLTKRAGLKRRHGDGFAVGPATTLAFEISRVWTRHIEPPHAGEDGLGLGVLAPEMRMRSARLGETGRCHAHKVDPVNQAGVTLLFA